MSREKVSKRQERRERMQRQQRRQRLTIIGLITLVAALLVFLVVWQPLSSAGEIIPFTPAALPDADGLSLGDPNAPATIDVFEDFQCSACKRFTDTIEPLVIENLVAAGKARYVFHNYPFLDGDGAGSAGESDQAANAALCANEQGKFWDMHGILYVNWNGENQGQFSDRRLQSMAENIGLDMDAFNSCFNANQYETDIQADFDLGKDMGVSGTPTVFVNNQRVGAANQIASYQEIADAVNAITPPQ
jgi:protein-disulfide isomerase